VDVPCWSPDIFPTLLAMTNISVASKNKLDGVDITEIIKGKQTTHQPIFSMHNSRIMSVRKGDWKLFVHNPGYFKPVDLSKWKDPRGPDGTTIIAPIIGQANPGNYPGVVPTKTENEIQLYNVKNDPTESKDLSGTEKEKVNELLQELEKFESSMIIQN
jgi:arylsulfatase A-like enzyme